MAARAVEYRDTIAASLTLTLNPNPNPNPNPNQVDAARYPHAPDVAQGKLDAYGQLSADYVQQSAPHMRAIGGMLRRLTGADEPVAPLKGRDDPMAPLTGGGAPSPHLNRGAPASATGAADTAADSAGAARPRTLPRATPQLV